MNYVELEIGAAGLRLFPRAEVTEASLTFGVKIGLVISVDQRHGNRIEGHLCLCLLCSTAQVGPYLNVFTFVFMYFTYLRNL